MEHPEYAGREYEDYGTERCEVTVHIGPSEDHPDKMPFSVATTGFRFADTYQAVARKALRHLCQIYERPAGRTSIKFFLRGEDSPTWLNRMKTLDGLGARVSDPTVVAWTRYQLALDDMCDRQAAELRRCIRRAEEGETRVRALRIQLAETKALVAEAEGRILAAEGAAKVAEERHNRLISEAYLTGRSNRRILHLPGMEGHPVLEGVPVCPLGSLKRRFSEAVPAPPPSSPHEVPGEEAPLLLTQHSHRMWGESEEEYTPLTPPAEPLPKESECVTVPPAA